MCVCVFFHPTFQLMIGKHFSALLFAHQFRQKGNTGRLFCLFISSLALLKKKKAVKEMNRENERSRSLSLSLVKLKYKGENKGNLPNLFKDKSSIELTNDAPLEPSKHREREREFRNEIGKCECISRFRCNAYTILAELKLALWRHQTLLALYVHCAHSTHSAL